MANRAPKSERQEPNRGDLGHREQGQRLEVGEHGDEADGDAKPGYSFGWLASAPRTSRACRGSGGDQDDAEEVAEEHDLKQGSTPASADALRAAAAMPTSSAIEAVTRRRRRPDGAGTQARRWPSGPDKSDRHTIARAGQGQMRWLALNDFAGWCRTMSRRCLSASLPQAQPLSLSSTNCLPAGMMLGSAAQREPEHG